MILKTFLTKSMRSTFDVSFLSYQCRWSIHCRSNSMGGWAPYFSRAGIFRSSTNTTHFLPGGGPYTPLRRLKRRSTQKRKGLKAKWCYLVLNEFRPTFYELSYRSSFDIIISCVCPALVRDEKFILIGIYLESGKRQSAISRGISLIKLRWSTYFSLGNPTR